MSKRLTGILDRLPPMVRHYIIMLIGSLLTWASVIAMNMKVPGNELATGVATAAATSFVGILGLSWTKFTEQYGRKKNKKTVLIVNEADVTYTDEAGTPIAPVNVVDSGTAGA